ncbi:MAG: HEAT repeat domain-containing protein [Planctomycetales bacterium]|nr:HEAT repeat domain-containing protein [Planctomycetales bacterium]
MAVVEIASRSLTAPKHDAGRLVMLSCLITVVLTAAMIASLTSAPSFSRLEEPLVLTYEYCGHRQEIVVEVGKNFHVSTGLYDSEFTQSYNGVMIANGHIHRVVGDDCHLSFAVKYRLKSGSADGMRLEDDRILKIGKPSTATYGGIGSPCAMMGPWIRRGIDPVPSLVRALRPDYNEFVTAITELRKLGPRGAGAIPRLIEGVHGQIQAPALHSYDRPVSGWAALALGDIGPAASSAIPALMQALNHENPRTRIAASVALWKIERHQSAVPELVRQLSAKDWEIRSMALDALGEIGAGAPTAVPALTGMLTTDDEPRIRQHAAGVLWEIARSRDVIPIHLEGLKSETTWMRAYAATFLGEMGWAARSTVPQIVSALLVSSDHDQEYMAKALALIDPDASLTVAELVKALQGDPHNHLLRGHAARTLGAFGKPALPVLSGHFRRGDLSSAQLALSACYWIGPSSLGFLAEVLNSPNVELRASAARSLMTFNHDPTVEEQNTALSILISHFDDPENKVTVAIDDSLIKIGPAAVPALKALLEQGGAIRERAEELIARIAREANDKK